ncbi:MAG TPA: hypothetical protein VFV81_00560 [Verrucomicrobiae bacterium]|nr:hypothetical protein [Verrucomicrobiae bacterium]
MKEGTVAMLNRLRPLYGRGPRSARSLPGILIFLSLFLFVNFLGFRSRFRGGLDDQGAGWSSSFSFLRAAPHPDTLKRELQLRKPIFLFLDFQKF